MSWANRFVGLPWADKGRTGAGLDCWGLARLVYSSELRIELPSYTEQYSSCAEGAEIAALIADETGASVWDRVDAARPFDLVLFRRGRWSCHVGIAIDGATLLHMAGEDQSKIGRLDDPRWRRRIAGIYRYRGSTVEAPFTPPSKTLSVLAAPLLDPGAARIERDLPHGLTIAEIVGMTLPGALETPGAFRVTLVTATGRAPVALDVWHRVRPAPGVRVVIRAIPGGDSVRSVLLAVVSIGASYLTGGVSNLLGVTGAFGQTLVTAGLTLVGTLLVNALVPMPQMRAEDGERRETFSISGWRNDVRPGAPVPDVFGRHRTAPPFAATSYTEIVGDDQYVRALFCPGYGPLQISDLRLGQTSLDDYDNVDIEIREGREDDDPVSLYPRQVIEEPFNDALVRPLPRDETGDVIDDGEAVDTPIVRFTAADAAEVSVLIGFPSGLFEVNDEGNVVTRPVEVRIRARLNGLGAWTEIVTLKIGAKKREPFVRQHTWTTPTRGRWQIEVNRLTAEETSTQVSDRTILTAIQSIRPEYPINMSKPVALIAVRIKATFQLSGALDDLNCIVEREAMVPDSEGVWTAGYARTPAVAYVAALTGPGSPFPVADAEIDWATLADWHDWCVAKGLRYDRIHDTATSLGETLLAIAAAGRATPRHDGVTWSVVIDRPQDLVVDHINPRNSADFGWSRTYFDPPDGFRVRFLDETADWAEAERIVPWPGHEGDVQLTETLELPGKTDPDEIWIEARRRMYELIHRADTFSALQDGATRTVTRGDLVMGSFDVLSRLQAAARVTAVSGSLVELDEELTIEDGTSYGLRFRTGVTEADTVGTSLVRPAAATGPATRVLRLTGTGPMPVIGETVHFGPIDTESIALRVRGIEPGEDFSARLIMIAAAPQIDTLTDAEVAPAWDGRIGEEIAASVLTPAVPVFTSIRSGVTGTGAADLIEILLAPGAGSSAAVTAFELDHRLTGAPDWITVSIPAAEGGAKLDVYDQDDAVDLRALAVASGTPGAYTSTIALTVGAEDPEPPAALDDEAIEVAGSLGHAIIGIAVPSTGAPDRIQLFRVPAGDALDRGIHAAGAPFAVSAGSTATRIDGDATRTNILTAGGFGSADGWNLGLGWTIAAGAATHAAGSAGDLSQGLTLSAGKAYRIAVDVAGRTAGSVTLRLIGGTAVDGAAVTADGQVLDRLTAATGNTALAFTADADFDGSLDQAILFRETAACIDAGSWDYWVEPQTDGGIAGPVAGPFTVTII